MSEKSFLRIIPKTYSFEISIEIMYGDVKTLFTAIPAIAIPEANQKKFEVTIMEMILPIVTTIIAK